METNFELRFYNTDKSPVDLKTNREITEYMSQDHDSYLDTMEKVYSENVWRVRAKWYRHEDDMERLSLQFPSVIFQLDGCGEEGFDIWRMWFLNGESREVQATITYTECIW